jgi:hypothetical protein
METEVDVREVRRVETRSGSTRFVLEDGHGNEYTTFREGIGEAAEALAGRRAVITFHEEERGRYRNVYLDSVAPSQAETEASASTGEANDADEVGWRARRRRARGPRARAASLQSASRGAPCNAPTASP